MRRKSRNQKIKKFKQFIDYSQTIDVYEHWENHNRIKKRRVLIVFVDMIAGMESNKKLSSIVTKGIVFKGKKT